MGDVRGLVKEYGKQLARGGLVDEGLGEELFRELYIESGIVIWDEWVGRRLKGWLREDFLVWWGCSSSGKTYTAACLVLMDWISYYWGTNVVVVSTTVEMLRQRVWGDIVRVLGLLRERVGVDVGEVIDSKMKVRWVRGDDRNVIKGVAVLKGSEREALSNLVGVHSARNIMVVDEMQGARRVVLDAVANRMKVGRFKFLGMGNPMSREDVLGVVSEPLGGWGELDDRVKSWRSKYGLVEFFDGRESPAMVDSGRYWYLSGREDFERKGRLFGVGSKLWWSQAVGFMPPEGLANVMISEGMVRQGGGMDEVRDFVGSVVRVGGFDPAYTLGGDRAVFMWGEVGLCGDGVVRFMRRGTRVVDFSERVEGESMVKYLAEWLVNEASRCRVRVEDIVIDATGVQEVFCDFVDEMSGGRVYRVNFGGVASKRMIYGVEGDKYFGNRVSEIWGVMMEYILSGQVKGMDEELVREVVSRALKGNSRGKVMLESKVEYKKRMGRSPDLGDALGLICIYMRECLGVEFGGGWGYSDSINVMDGVGLGSGIEEGDGYAETDEEAEAIRRSSAGWLGMAGQGHGVTGEWDYI